MYDYVYYKGFTGAKEDPYKKQNIEFVHQPLKMTFIVDIIAHCKYESLSDIILQKLPIIQWNISIEPWYPARFQKTIMFCFSYKYIYDEYILRYDQIPEDLTHLKHCSVLVYSLPFFETNTLKSSC